MYRIFLCVTALWPVGWHILLCTWRDFSRAQHRFGYQSRLYKFEKRFSTSPDFYWSDQQVPRARIIRSTVRLIVGRPSSKLWFRGRAFPESVPRTAWSNVGAQYHTRLLLLFHVKLSLFLSQRSFLIRSCRYEAVVKFLERNELLGVIRGHEVQDSG
jgi:hypothetical protein